MDEGRVKAARCAALVGQHLAGKTSLLEAMQPFYPCEY